MKSQYNVLKSITGNLREMVPVLVTFVGIFVLWELATVVFKIPIYTLPAPSDIIAVMIEKRSQLLQHTMVTFTESAIGLGLSIVLSIPLGIVIVYSSWIERTVYPLL
ncbi:MAG: ABC transporter permease, partial [Hyphomicrobiales bacterium]|nr:ABC transporter permease [Hyphomicrobiales bacterium]